MAKRQERKIDAFFAPLTRAKSFTPGQAAVADALVVVRCLPAAGVSGKPDDQTPADGSQQQPQQQQSPRVLRKRVRSTSPSSRKDATAVADGSGKPYEAGAQQQPADQPEQPPLAAMQPTAGASPKRVRRRSTSSSGGAVPEPQAAAALPAGDATPKGGAAPAPAPQQADVAQGTAAPQAAATAAAGQRAPAAVPPEKAAAGAATGEGEEELTSTQRAQIAANRNHALAKRAVAAADQPGAPPLALVSVLVEPSWLQALEPELAKASARQLEAFLQAEWGAAASGRGKPIYPPRDCLFRALNSCPLDQIKVVVLGQDPYHGAGQAMGLSFSVPRACRPLPPSLLNIFKEARTDLGWERLPAHGDLSGWAVQGVLLLNACLSVREGDANSHAGRGWEALTDAAISAVSARSRGVVFLLWGKSAQAKRDLVKKERGHHVLTSAHPSPLSASRGFFGCRHFSTTNKLLEAQGKAPIDWAAGLF